MITEIIKKANLTGAKDERLPYPLGNAAVSKLDSATEEQKECSSEFFAMRCTLSTIYHMM